MSATEYEQELAQTRGIQILYHSKPVALDGDSKGVRSITFEKAQTAEQFTLQVDMLFKAIGQFLLPEYEGLELDGKKIKVNEKKETSLKGVYAGGDCIHHKEDLTVAAVQDGKLAGYAIHEALTGEVLRTNHTLPRPSTFVGGHHHG